MRAPGAAEGNFAIESALDELSYDLRIDPIELRLRNYAEVQPQSGLPWSSKALRECYRVGAERFGWTERNPEIGSMRDGNWLVGYGMAGVTYEWYSATLSGQALDQPRRQRPRAQRGHRPRNRHLHGRDATCGRVARPRHRPRPRRDR